ncbi:MAG: amidohydrolase [Pseudomonadota bacterium]
MTPSDFSRRTALPLLLVALGTAQAQAAPLPTAQQKQILSFADGYQPSLDTVAKAIWDYSEVGYHETRSSKLLQDELTKAGFEVKAGVAGMPTAFIASYKRGRGPVIGILAEFDALPDMAQTIAPEKQGIAGKAAGHACGHNLFGAASVAAAINTAQWMAKNNINGEVRLYGTPAEEGGGGKVYFARDGFFQDVDAVVNWHPGNSNSAAQSRWLATINVNFEFRGASAHAAGAPQVGRSALDAVEAMNAMVNMMREHVPQETRIHYAITDTPKAPNIVPAYAKVFYVIRHPDEAEDKAIFDRVVKAAEGAALGTGTTMSYSLVGSFKNMLINDTLGQVMDRNLRTVGGVKLTAAEKQWAGEVQTRLPAGTKKPLTEFETIRPYTTNELVSASSDVGDVSYVAPTVGLSTATFVPGTPGHSWQVVAASGHPVGMKGAGVAARTMALTAAELMTSPDVLKKAKAEWAERRGPNYKYETLMKDGKPPLNYWSE